jgi:ABC-type Fe3+ transport system substrate-binding protein
MRRSIWITLFLIVLITPFLLRLAVGAGSQSQRVDRHSPRLIVVTPHAEAIRTEFGDAFSRWHQSRYGSPVTVDYRIYGGASDIARFFESARKTLYQALGTYQIDVVWGGGDDFFDRRLREPGHLQGVRLPDEFLRRAYAQKELNGLALYDQKSDPPQWFGTALSSFGIVYNRDVLVHLNLSEPRTWKDLADARYRGWIVLADPLRSGVARTAFMVIVERAMQDAVDAGRSADEGWARGMGLIRQIAANARMFTDNGSGVPAIVGAGEAAAGMAIDFQARSQVDALQVGNSSRLGYIEPAGATAINPDPVGVVKGAERREIAEHFVEFLLSEPGQRLWNARAGKPSGPKRTSLRRLPIMKSVYDNPVDFTDGVNPYVASGSFNTSPTRAATSNILSELIQASCMEPLDELRAARQAIQQSPRAAELDAKLGVFPFDQKEALARLATWKSASPLERLTLQRRWTEEFKSEYRRLRVESEKGE